ncbi:hypothetical protein LX32DRAFT_303792 [Colletotrichum zoysiae]|uniref:Uncharacterized protein n=1 Tax=Colletotrichum zoysiae TaxID=1216348 RepID=A0AAD9HMU3_9PEZI|nr:hypothetical protein LX32DRAFT_303792 [Colletotrichum zoysiae]
MLSSRLLAVLGIAGVVTAFPQIQVPSDQCPQTMCIDGINPECNIRWGGCYDRCKPDTRPTMPPCKPAPSQPVSRKTPHHIPPIWPLPGFQLPFPSRSVSRGPPSGPPSPTKPPSHPNPKPTASDSCSTRTICRDFINECGQMYGGCHSDCQPWPSFTAPPCASSELITPSTPANRD